MDDPAPEVVGETDPIVWATVIEKLDTVMREGLKALGYM